MKADQIQKLASLAKLKISQETLDKTAQSISEVLVLVDQLKAVNTEAVSPMAHPLDAVQTLREDKASEPNQREKFQSMAPNVEDGLYLVPKVID